MEKHLVEVAYESKWYHLPISIMFILSMPLIFSIIAERYLIALIGIIIFITCAILVIKLPQERKYADYIYEDGKIRRRYLE